MTTTALAAPPAALAALADPVRWRIVGLLGREELCVCHLVEELGVTQSLVSHHLKVLRAAGVVEGERWRYWTYYRIVPGALRALAAEVAGAAPSGERGERRPCC